MPRARRPVRSLPLYILEGGLRGSSNGHHAPRCVVLCPAPPSPLGFRDWTGFVLSGLRRRGFGISRMVATYAAAGLAACGTRGDAEPDRRVSAVAESAMAESKGDAAVAVVDDAGRTVQLPHPARRVVSLIPSATETLLAIGAGPLLVGRTRYDVAPEVQHLPLVGGSVDPSIEAIAALRPDLVVSWESDKRQQFRERLERLGVPIFMLRTQDTSDVYRGLHNLGVLTGHSRGAELTAARLRAELDSVRISVAALPRPRVLYVVFNDPPMTVGPHTFIGQLIDLAGGTSIFADAATNWPNVPMEEIVRRNPDIVIVPVGEFKGQALERLRVMPGWRTLPAVREGRLVQVPANLLSRPSPNIGKAARVLRAAMFPAFASAVHAADTAWPALSADGLAPTTVDGRAARR